MAAVFFCPSQAASEGPMDFEVRLVLQLGPIPRSMPAVGLVVFVVCPLLPL